MTDLDVYQPAAAEPYQARLAMTPEAAKALDDQLRLCTKAVLREGTDYGTIPGAGDRKVLFKAGAEKLLQWFGFGFTCHQQGDIERDASNKQGVTYRCTVLKRLPDGTSVDVATCEGYAGYDEDKFYHPADEAARFKAEARERKYAKIDGRPANPNKWQHITDYKAPWNTVIKMAQKRAIVGATIDATAAAGLFTTEEDSSPAADDGSTWYEQALEQALTFTDPGAGSKLYTDAAQAGRDGLCTPRQADHVQNRTRQRLRLLAIAPPVDVEDLGRPVPDPSPAATADPPLAEAAPGQAPAQPAAGEAPSSEDAKQEAAPGSDRHKKLVGAVHGQFARLLGRNAKDETEPERAERLWMAAKLAGVNGISSLSDLDTGELSQVVNALATCKDRQRLDDMLAELATA